MINPDTWPVRKRMQVEDGAAGAGGGSVRRLLDRMRHSAFQGRKLGEAFETWRWMIDQGCLIAMGLAGSMASAGLAPLLIWLVERGYVDVLVSTSANATEDLLEARGTPFYQVDPDHVDDRGLWQQGFYRFYDHVVSATCACGVDGCRRRCCGHGRARRSRGAASARDATTRDAHRHRHARHGPARDVCALARRPADCVRRVGGRRVPPSVGAVAGHYDSAAAGGY